MAMNVSAFSFVDVAQAGVQALMPNGGAMLSMTYLGAERVIPNYNTMGRGQGGAGGGDALHRPATWGRAASGSTPSRPAPCAPCRWPESPAVGG